jgi:translation initiation factor IF-3
VTGQVVSIPSPWCEGKADAWRPLVFLYLEGGTGISFDRKRAPRIRANEGIRVPEIRVIDAEGNQLGVMATQQALQMAREQALDLVEVSPTSRPPVCRIMDFGKYKYELSKKTKQSKKKQHTFQVKEVKFRPKTEEHDYQFKKRHAEEFLEKHYKVKVTLMFRGREMDHKELGYRILDRLTKDLVHIGTVERSPEFEGRLMVMYFSPLPTKTPSKPKATKSKPTKETNDAQAEDKPIGEETLS